MKIFELRKIKLLKDEIDLIKENAKREGRYSLFNSRFVKEIFDNKKINYSGLRYYFDLIKEHDKNCKIPYNIGLSIDAFTEYNNIFVHRTKLNYENEESDELYSIMKDGLKNYGHTGVLAGGSTNINPNVTLTMTPLDGLAGYINLISSYKDNNTIVLAAFPKEIVDKEGNILTDYNEVYDNLEKEPTFKEKYMLGAFVKGNNELWDFYLKDQIIENKKQATK